MKEVTNKKNERNRYRSRRTANLALHQRGLLKTENTAESQPLAH